MMETIAEIEKTLKTGKQESKVNMAKVNTFVLESLFKDGEQGKINKAFEKASQV